MVDMFDQNDIGVLETVANLMPELRVCAQILKRARKMNLRFPVNTHRNLVELLDGKKLETVENHDFTASHIKYYVAKDFFPIADEKELARAVFIGLCQCRQDMHWAASAPANAKELLNNISKWRGE